MHIGFVGAGNIGQGLARLTTAAGHAVMMSNSRGPASLAGIAADLEITAATVAQTAQGSDIIVLSVPFTSVFAINPEPFEGRLIVDTTNYYPTRDGQFDALDTHATTTSLMVQEHFAGSTVAKAFNAILASDLTAPFGLPHATRALPIAGDDDGANLVMEGFHEQIGFDVLSTGSLADSWRFERAKPAYCIPLDLKSLKAAVNAATRDVELPHNSWHRE